MTNNNARTTATEEEINQLLEAPEEAHADLPIGIVDQVIVPARTDQAIEEANTDRELEFFAFGVETISAAVFTNAELIAADVLRGMSLTDTERAAIAVVVDGIRQSILRTAHLAIDAVTDAVGEGVEEFSLSNKALEGEVALALAMALGLAEDTPKDAASA